MSHYAVVRVAGPGWGDGGIAEQPGVAEHAAFVNGLATEGGLLAAGPLYAESDVEIRRRLADDPWAQADRLVVTTIEPWNLIVGADRLTASPM